MKKMIKGLLNIPIPYALSAGVVALILVVMTVQGQLTILGAVVVSILAALVGLQFHLGSIVIKSALSIMAVFYTIAIYTDIVITVHGNIVEPFLLSIASVTVFLAVTYNSKRYNYGIRSRALWAPIVSTIIVSVKMAFILSGYSFIITEIVGLNLLVILIALWILWMGKADKTKIVKPAVIKEETLEKFKFIHIENRLNVVKNVWLDMEARNENAYPYIYNEALKANEKGLSLVIVSKATTSKIYDVGEIELNKSNKLLYLYMEAKENDYVEDTMESFIEELSRLER